MKFASSSLAAASMLAVSLAARAALPAGWGDLDIGSPGIAGSASYSDGVWTVAGGGTDIWNSSDQFNYLTNSLNGDGAVIARVITQTPTDPWAQAGVMIRNDTTAGSPEVAAELTVSNGVAFRYRYTEGGVTYQVFQTGIATPEWVRLSRSSNTFTAAYSSDGVNWTQIGSPQTISMNSSVLAGLDVTAHNNSLVSTGGFTGVYIVPGPQVGVPASLYNPYTGEPAFVWESTWPLPQLNVASNAMTPRMGWNSWFVVGDATGPSENLITNTAASLVADGLAAAGYKTVTIDCTWIASGRGYRNTNGDLIVDSTRWPDGMNGVANNVHNLGLFMGGYSDIGASGYGRTWASSWADILTSELLAMAAPRKSGCTPITSMMPMSSLPGDGISLKLMTTGPEIFMPPAMPSKTTSTAAPLL